MARTEPAEVAQYIATGPSYLDRLYAEGDTINWDGVPNHLMKPVNDAAHAAVKAHAAGQPPTQAVAVEGAILDAQAILREAALRNRAEEAEFAVAEKDEEIAKLTAQVTELTNERDAAKVTLAELEAKIAADGGSKSDV